MRVLVLTDLPSPYQVELFNAIEASSKCKLEVAYLRNSDPNRQWKPSPVHHMAIDLDGLRDGMAHARDSARDADLVVFNYYQHSNAEKLIKERARLNRPWCFWGERPGVHQPAWTGRLIRKWKLSELYASTAPIWGIGKFAIDGYRKEFGAQREYFNLPYFSDLERYINTDGRGSSSERVFLFSGSLIKRKGVDLLASAFVRLSREVSNLKLKIVGAGKHRQSLAQTLRPVIEQVEFVGFRDWDELPAEYARADVLCTPSRYDGWGLVVPEGLASGLPVIATDRMGAALEFLETGHNGWLIPANDEDAIVDAMRQAALLPQAELAELRCRARQSVGNHSLQHGAERFLNFAQQAIEQWPKGYA